MNIPYRYEHIYNKEISNEEYEVINKFLEFYKKQNIIIADEYSQYFNTVPLEDEKIIFKTKEDVWKSINFCKRIFYKNKPYIVQLELWRNSINPDEPRCLQIQQFNIIANERVHFIDLNIEDIRNRKILFNIMDIFDEKKIISPEQGYCKKMYTNKVLQDFLINHEWEKINEGIQQMPSLVNALFIMREGYESDIHYSADFATVLYQLISFRNNNISSLINNEKDLHKLDKLILKLIKTELLKVRLYEKNCGTESYPNDLILLQSNNYNGRIHKSMQYNINNTELLTENIILKKLIKDSKNK